MNGYDLTRQWFDFAFENKDCKPEHTALYLWIVELNNRLGWKKEFNLPTGHTMELGFSNRNRFLAILADIERWGFIQTTQAPVNQNKARYISICHIKCGMADDTALDMAIVRQDDSTVHGSVYSGGYGGGYGTDTKDKPRNQETKKPRNSIVVPTEREEVIESNSAGVKSNQRHTFTKPSAPDVSAYFTERTGLNGVKAENFSEQFVNHYESKGWRIGKEMMKDWRAAVRTWLAKDPEKYYSRSPNPEIRQPVKYLERFTEEWELEERKKSYESHIRFFPHAREHPILFPEIISKFHARYGMIGDPPGAEVNYPQAAYYLGEVGETA